jgi:hypothetical protein
VEVAVVLGRGTAQTITIRVEEERVVCFREHLLQVTHFLRLWLVRVGLEQGLRMFQEEVAPIAVFLVLLPLAAVAVAAG